MRLPRPCVLLRCFALGALGAAFALLAPSVRAQTAGGARNAPHLAYVYPAGAQRGQTITLTLGGQYLADAGLVHLAARGLTATIREHNRPLTQKEATDLREQIEQLRQKRRTLPKEFTAADGQQLTRWQETLTRRNPNPKTPALAETITVELTVAPDAQPGTHELRLSTRAGLSNPVAFIVGTLPEFTAPLAQTAATAPRREAQATSRSRPLEVSPPAVVNGQILPGEIDAVRFAGRRGQVLTVALQARALIPYLADAVPGWIQAVLHLRDPQGHEIAFNDDFAFRPDPALACTLPVDGDYTLEIHDALYRGREDFVYRATLGELPLLRSVYPLGTAQRAPADVELTGWNLPSSHLRVDAAAEPVGPLLLSLQRDGHRSNAVRFAIGGTPELAESASAAPLTFAGPLLLNGRILRADERDTYRFTGRSGQTIHAEIFARRLDSPLDSLLELRTADGRLLAANDDTEDKAEGLLTHHADSLLTARLPADGDYTLTVSDTQHRGGPEFGYRLSVRPPQPDFALRATPSAVNLPAGGSAVVTVFALRRDGFDGPIALALESPAAGVALDGGVIPAGVDAVQITLTAGADRKPGVIFPLKLAGHAEIGPRTVAHAVIPCDDTMQAFLYRHLVPATQWLGQITPRATGLSPTAGQLIRLPPNAKVQVKFELAPGQPTFESMTAELLNPPPGLSVEQTTLRGRQLVVTLATTSAPPPARQAAGNLVFSLAGTRATRGNAEAKPRPLGITRAIRYEFAPTK